MPGGQYTNLREQARALGLGARWPEVVRYYHEVNAVLGDIVKVTPSSKVVGDLAIFLLTKGVEPKDMVNLEPGSAFPESVVDMLSGGRQLKAVGLRIFKGRVRERPQRDAPVHV